MPKRLSLTFACGDYEIVRPLIDGKVEVDGVDLTILTDMDSATRHWRFLRDGEFDAAEVSASSYLAARDNDWPFRAIPAFLHRRFRHGFMFINTMKGIAKPADLKGRKIGVKTLMTTAVLWMRGILQHEYGVPLNSIDWFAELEDDVEVPLDALPGQAEEWERTVSEMADEDEDIRNYVRALEERGDDSLTETSGEAIAAEFERYLRRRGRGPSHGPGTV